VEALRIGVIIMSPETSRSAGARWKRVLGITVSALLLLPLPVLATVTFGGNSWSGSSTGNVAALFTSLDHKTFDIDFSLGGTQTSFTGISGTFTVVSVPPMTGNGIQASSASDSIFADVRQAFKTITAGSITIQVTVNGNNMFSTPPSVLSLSNKTPSVGVGTAGAVSITVTLTFTNASYTVAATPFQMTFEGGR
jgi:hypothetical protein